MKISKTTLLLIHLIEECAEVIQRACKAIRFGMEEVQPGQGLNNRERLETELVDLKTVDGILHRARALKGFSPEHILDMITAKQKKIEKYALYSQQLGIVEGIPQTVRAGTPIEEKTMVAGMRVICGACRAVLRVQNGYPKVGVHEPASGPAEQLCTGRAFKLYEDFTPPLA